jgi:hypothetical protein
MSSIATENVSVATWQNIAAGKIGNAPGKVLLPSTLLYDSVLRQFTAGTVLRYGFEVYNAKHSGSVSPQLETQARILQNSSVVYEGKLSRVDTSSQKDPKRIQVTGAVMLKGSLQPGDYVLQITTLDRASNQAATQVFPFEIIK